MTYNPHIDSDKTFPLDIAGEDASLCTLDAKQTAAGIEFSSAALPEFRKVYVLKDAAPCEDIEGALSAHLVYSIGLPLQAKIDLLPGDADLLTPGLYYVVMRPDESPETAAKLKDRASWKPHRSRPTFGT